MRDGESVDGSVNQHDFPVIADFTQECRVHSDPFIHAIIDGVGESSPCGVAPGSGCDVMHAHFSFGRRGHLAVDEIQGEHLTGQFVPVFVHPQDLVGKRLFEIADVALVVRVNSGLDETDQGTWWGRCGTAAMNGTPSESGGPAREKNRRLR